MSVRLCRQKYSPSRVRHRCIHAISVRGIVVRVRLCCTLGLYLQLQAVLTQNGLTMLDKAEREAPYRVQHCQTLAGG